MLSIGIDCGSQNTKGVLLRDAQVIARAKVATAFDANQAAEEVYAQLLVQGGVQEGDIDRLAVTGTGREMFLRGKNLLTEVAAAARGARYVRPECRMIIDMGADSCRVIRLGEQGNVTKYETNDKCASGAGTFIEAMARALQIDTEEMGDYSLRHTKELVTNAQCVVFAESEVISLIHRQESVENIAYGIHMGIASRVASLVRRVGLSEPAVFAGGPGHNQGLLECMGKELGCALTACPDTDYISAIGAALCAAEA